jgi:hypothetical protein
VSERSERGEGNRLGQVETSGAPHEIKEHTYANLVKQTAESEALVGSHVDLYQIHSATRESGVLQAADVLGELARLKADKGWRIGLTLSGARDVPLTRDHASERRVYSLGSCMSSTSRVTCGYGFGALRGARQTGCGGGRWRRCATGRVAAGGDAAQVPGRHTAVRLRSSHVEPARAVRGCVTITIQVGVHCAPSLWPPVSWRGNCIGQRRRPQHTDVPAAPNGAIFSIPQHGWRRGGAEVEQGRACWLRMRRACT